VTHRKQTHHRSRRPRPSPSTTPQPPPAPDADALAIAIERNDWERAALLLMLGVSAVARTLPAGDIDDLLALLDREEPAR